MALCMRVLLTLCQSDERFRCIPVSAKAMLEARKGIRGQGTKRIVPSELHIIDLSPFALLKSFPGETYLALSNILRINTPDTDVHVISNISLFAF